MLIDHNLGNLKSIKVCLIAFSLYIYIGHYPQVVKSRRNTIFFINLSNVADKSPWNLVSRRLLFILPMPVSFPLKQHPG